MYKRIDDVQEQKVVGYSFVDGEGDICYVTLPTNEWEYLIAIGWEEGFGNHRIVFAKNDIPKLIKALEAAYNHKEA